MKAVVFYGQNDIRLVDDWPEPPPPKEGEVKQSVVTFPVIYKVKHYSPPNHVTVSYFYSSWYTFFVC